MIFKIIVIIFVALLALPYIYGLVYVIFRGIWDAYVHTMSQFRENK